MLITKWKEKQNSYEILRWLQTASRHNALLEPPIAKPSAWIFDIWQISLTSFLLWQLHYNQPLSGFADAARFSISIRTERSSRHFFRALQRLMRALFQTLLTRSFASPNTSGLDVRLPTKWSSFAEPVTVEWTWAGAWRRTSATSAAQTTYWTCSTGTALVGTAAVSAFLTRTSWTWNPVTRTSSRTCRSNTAASKVREPRAVQLSTVRWSGYLYSYNVAVTVLQDLENLKILTVGLHTCWFLAYQTEDCFDWQEALKTILKIHFSQYYRVQLVAY